MFHFKKGEEKVKGKDFQAFYLKNDFSRF